MKKSESFVFWLSALVAGIVVLFGSVAVGKVIGAQILSHGYVAARPMPDLKAPKPPEVIGGLRHTAAVPGDDAPPASAVATKPR